MAEYNPSKIIKDGNTYNFRDITKIPLAGSNEISGSLIPSTDGTVDLGSSTAQWNNAYIKSLAINGVATGDILTHNASEFVLVNDLSTVATSGSYNDLSNKPTIPTVNDGTLTIKVNDTTAGIFTANQATNEEINITTGDVEYATDAQIDALTSEWSLS
jgi:hypothetical protein